MKKNIAIAGILLAMVFNTGCGKFIPRKDQSQIVTFKNLDSEKDVYTLKLYKLNYPQLPHEQDEFYKKFDVLASKMIAHKKDINLIIPFELYEDFLNLRKQSVRTGEKVFGKPAYTLSQEEKDTIDGKINVDYPKDAGSTQKYLNRQTAYWYNYLKRGYEYDKNKYYTELDKNKLIEEVLKNREIFADTTLLIEGDYALEVISQDVLQAGKTGLPLYIYGENIDMSQFQDISSKIIIVQGDVPESVIPGKILLLTGKNTSKIKNYTIKTVVEEVNSPYDLIPLLHENNGIELKDLENFSIKNISSFKTPKASVREKESPRKGMNFINIESKWRIEE